MLRTCPVLAFTPDVESALRWFSWTHALMVIPMVGVRYERVCWPAAGGAGEQDAWLTQALQFLRHVHNAILREALPKRKRKQQQEDGSRGRG